MTLEDWIAALFAKVQPPTGTPERAIAYLKPRLEDLSPFWFTEDAIAGIWMGLRSLNSADRVRKALRDYHAQQAPPPAPVPRDEHETDAWEERQAFLRRDWDDPAGILRKVNACGGDVKLLRWLAFLVAKWAPQHLGLLPPHILAAVSQDSDLPVLVELRRKETWPASPSITRNEQIAAIAEPPAPREYHLPPDVLDQLNPLPDGRKRV